MKALIMDISRERELRHEFFRLSAPFVRMKCDILAINAPKFLVHADGRTEAVCSPEVTRALAQVDTLWDEARNAFVAGLEVEQTAA